MPNLHTDTFRGFLHGSLTNAGKTTSPVVDDKGSCPFRFPIFRVGHPWSATGGRIVTTLACEMARRNAQCGIASICAAGAMAGALILER